MLDDADRARIVDYWHAIELFSPQAVDRVNHPERVYRAEAGELLPWEPGHAVQRIRLKPGQALRHVVFCGVYSLAPSRRFASWASVIARYWRTPLACSMTTP